MRATLYLNNTKVTKKYVTDLIGIERLDRILAEAQEVYEEDRNICNQFWLGGGNYLEVRFS